MTKQFLTTTIATMLLVPLFASADVTLPSISLPTASAVTATTSVFGATITSDGGSVLTARGTCWGVSPSPLTNCLADSSTSTGAFTQSRTSLPAGTIIFYRGYATNSTGTSYTVDATTTTLALPAPTIPQDVVTCLQNAVEKQYQTMTTARVSYNTAILAALTTRKDALKAAYTLGDKDTLNKAVENAVTNYTKIAESTQKTLRDADNGSRTTFNKEKEGCKTMIVTPKKDTNKGGDKEKSNNGKHLGEIKKTANKPDSKQKNSGKNENERR